MPHVFITGDKHGRYKDIEHFCLKWNTSKDDLLIVLGDNGVNYYQDKRDEWLKQYLSSLPISFFMIKGNHDARPDLSTYDELTNPHDLVYGKILVEEKYPNIMFSYMYGKYDFQIDKDKWINTFVLGGAYSADKWYRLNMQKQGFKDYAWFEDEQMSDKEMQDSLKELKKITIDKKKDLIILSHTCPHKYIPRDMFLPQIDQSTVDDTMEHWFDKIEEIIPYQKWYCGHWHTDRTVDKIKFMYYDIIQLE